MMLNYLFTLNKLFNVVDSGRSTRGLRGLQPPYLHEIHGAPRKPKEEEEQREDELSNIQLLDPPLVVDLFVPELTKFFIL
jgi:hypothetical protein